MIANKLKYIINVNESVLAIALNSEYTFTADLAKVIRIILLSKIYDYDREKIEQYLIQNHKYRHKKYMIILGNQY